MQSEGPLQSSHCALKRTRLSIHDSCITCSQNFIKKYVQCYNCSNPETVVKIKKESIYLKCKACGFVSDVDMRHRLNTYILKNPPEEKVSKAEKKCGRSFIPSMLRLDFLLGADVMDCILPFTLGHKVATLLPILLRMPM